MVKNILEVAKSLNIDENEIELYGKNKAKIDTKIKEKDIKDKKLILVTAITPTKYGEGKTTMSIALSDGLNAIGKKSVLSLREPSLGPVFGLKGGATGGGKALLYPSDDINLHFTGDIHAITSANNLICAALDNHIFQGNSLNIDLERIYISRCLDMNDRALRDITIKSGKRYERKESFIITVASEIMAIFCLAENITELKEMISNILVAKDKDGNNIYVKDLKVEGAVAALLKDAIKPNLVQTLEGNPAIVHGGPFANIAHGCSSVIATKTALKYGDYVVTEAGFGSDLGAEKFFDIKCRKAGIYPDLAVLVVSIRALKEHGNIEKGAQNLLKHYTILEQFVDNIVVCINEFEEDTEKELLEIIRCVESKIPKDNIIKCSGFKDGSQGSIDLAKKVVNIIEEKDINKEKRFAYNIEDGFLKKVYDLNSRIYSAEEIIFEEKAKNKLKSLEKDLDGKLICVAKSPYDITDDDKKEKKTITFTDVDIKNGAGFIVLKVGKTLIMPGLPKIPQAEKIDIDENGNAINII